MQIWAEPEKSAVIIKVTACKIVAQQIRSTVLLRFWFVFSQTLYKSHLYKVCIQNIYFLYS